MLNPDPRGLSTGGQEAELFWFLFFLFFFLVDTKETERTLAFPVQGARPWQLQSSVLCANVSLRSLLFP